jgi:DNA-directed RNA polymerase subunit RPC12/RpoP
MHNIDLVLWVPLILAVSLAVGFALVLIDTVRRSGRFGINLDLPNCPRCGHQVRAVRIPKSIPQFLWGGYTCTQCGTEIDKWGNEI